MPANLRELRLRTVKVLSHIQGNSLSLLSDKARLDSALGQLEHVSLMAMRDDIFPPLSRAAADGECPMSVISIINTRGNDGIPKVSDIIPRCYTLILLHGHAMLQNIKMSISRWPEYQDGNLPACLAKVSW